MYADETRKVHPGTVGIVDGFCKVLIMVSVCCFITELEPRPKLVSTVYS